MGTLYYGDNLDILHRYLKDDSIDLVYLDPPFNSAQNYNAFFQEKDGTAAASQIRAFADTWTWNQESQRVYEELILKPGKVSEVMQAFKTFLGTNDMMAYLAMMCPGWWNSAASSSPPARFICTAIQPHRIISKCCWMRFWGRVISRAKSFGSERARTLRRSDGMMSMTQFYFTRRLKISFGTKS